MADKWEYWTGTFHADIENPGAKQFIKQRWPNWKAQKFAPQTLIPELNRMGEEGWELVYMEPVAGVGNNGDIYFTGEYPKYSNNYFVVMKRKKEES